MTKTELPKARLTELLSEISLENVAVFVRHLSKPGKSYGVIGHINNELDRGRSLQAILESMPSHYWLTAKSLGENRFSFGYCMDKTFPDDSGYREFWTFKLGVLGEIVGAEKESEMFLD
jgi:hypothetical protein